MKKCLLCQAICLLVLFTGCSDDDSLTPLNNETIQELSKVITYMPSKQSYENGEIESTKNVQYFEGTNVIADTTFDISGNIHSRVAHIYTSNSYELNYYHGTSLNLKLTYIYDSLGRIIEIKSDNSFLYQGFPNQGLASRKLIYENGQVVCERYDENNQLMPQYTRYYLLNTTGLITFDSNFIGDKLVANNLSMGSVAMDYYDVAKPANMLKSIYQLNNLFFESSEYRVHMAENNNYYLQSYSYINYNGISETVTFESEFDDLGYILHTKGTGVVANYEADRNLERFYYYD